MEKDIKPKMGEQYYNLDQTVAEEQVLMADKPVKVLNPDEQKMKFGEQTYPC